ncbi:IL2RA protein, partial [Rhinopomastus cyanomelas]|nr:IL2RA protein [Rhinopomastus cyanomelas]
CPVLPRTEFADVTAERYPPGTKLYYECDSGYTRRSGQYSGIWCQSGQPAAGWRYKDFQCIDRNTLLSAAPTKNLDLTQETERKPVSPAPQKPGNVSEVEEQGFCGPPKTIPHASIRPSNQYYLGQVLHFKCQSGYDKRPPTSGTRTCKKEQGQIIWTVLDMRCTSDS